MTPPAPPMRVMAFLVVRASGDMRITKKQPVLKMDEVAFKVHVTIPRTWGRLQSTSIDLIFPEPPEALVQVEEA